MFIRLCNYKQTTKKCDRLPKHAIAQAGHLKTERQTDSSTPYNTEQDAQLPQ